MFDAKLFLEAYITLFVIMDPPGTLPIFLALTNGRTRQLRHRAAWQAATVSFCVICVRSRATEAWPRLRRASC